MKRSVTVKLTLLTSVAALVTSCDHPPPTRYCVDDNQRVMDLAYCQDQQRLGHGYRWYYGGSSGYVPTGTRINGGSFNSPSGGFSEAPSATTRGGIGGAGEAAAGHGGGEGAGGHGGGGGE